jgi:hypothetical protein
MEMVTARKGCGTLFISIKSKEFPEKRSCRTDPDLSGESALKHPETPLLEQRRRDS